MTRDHVDGAQLRQQRASISACAGSHFIDLIDIIPELTGSSTLRGSSVTIMQPADLRDCYDFSLHRSFDLSWSRRVFLQCLMRSRVVIQPRDTKPIVPNWRSITLGILGSA